MPAGALGPLEEINRIIRDNRVGEYHSAGEALGMRPIQFAPGRADWMWERQPSSAVNPFGTISGGYLALFVDEILSSAIGSVMQEGEWAVTAELKLSFMRALKPAPLRGYGFVLRRTRAVAFLEAEISSTADNQPGCAVKASSTWVISRST